MPFLRFCTRAAAIAFAVLLCAAATDAPPQAVVRTTLENGLRVVIVRNALAPVVTTEVSYLVGSDEAPPGFPGTAHAQEHMMFQGSPGLSAAQLADIIAGMGGDFDAQTQQTVTQYSFTVPAQDLAVALHVHAIRMRGVLDSEDAWQRERPAIEQEVDQDLSNPQYKLYAELLHAAFKGTPYEEDALGTRASFDATTGAMLKEFHDRWYVPNNAVLVVVGDVEPNRTLATIQSLFGDIPAKPTPPRRAVRLQPMAAQTSHRDSDLPYGLAVVAFRLPGFRSPDYAAAGVLADALSSRRGALYRLVLDGEALSADFSIDALPEAAVGYATAAFPHGADGEKLLGRLRETLADAAAQGLSTDLVDAAKRAELAQREFDKNSIPGLADAWSTALAVEGRSSPDEDVQAIQRLSAADVGRVLRGSLASQPTFAAVLVPHFSGKPVSSTRFAGKESFAPERSVGVALPSWAQPAVERVSVPPLTLHPVSMRLANGIQLIVQPESISDTVSVFGHIRNRPALEAPRGEEGVSQVLARLFSYGTSSLSQAQFEKALDDIAASESAGTDFSLQVLAGHFERGVELLAQNELEPALPEDAFRIVRQQVAAAVAGELESPSFLTSEALKRALFPKDDPEVRHATPQSVEALTLTAVRAYYREVFRPDLTTIVVIGNVTPQRAKVAVERYFGAWEAQGPEPTTQLPRVPPNRPVTTVVPDDSRIQDNVTLAETLGLDRYDPDYYALRLGNRVLSGGFFATRLYRDLRQNTGLVYYVSSDFDVRRTRALYLVQYACDPPNVARARAIVERDLRMMQTTPISAGELRQATAQLLKQIPLSQASVDAVAQGLLERVELGLPLDEPWRAAHYYTVLNAEQVRAAYARWLRVDDLVQVTEGPAPR